MAMSDSLNTDQNENRVHEKYDFIVIGSGAGGGPVACNLALKGFRVLLLEAGGEDEPLDYQVPAFHARASENEALRWDYFVRHYGDIDQQEKDEKFRKEQDGVLYPRSGTLGGCTAHNAMVMMYPHNSDWDYIAKLMNDPTWHSKNMHKYFKRLERCEYIPKWKFWSRLWSRHGFDGWLPTSIGDSTMLRQDKVLKKLTGAVFKESIWESWHTTPSPIRRIFRIILKLRSRLDPNHWRLIRKNLEGLSSIPVTIHQGRRAGTREYLQRVRKEFPDNLVIKTNALVQRVLLDEHNKAYGVEYSIGSHQYRADPKHKKADTFKVEKAFVEREVIISAGAFNTPQLLMLSGIGPRDELEKHHIETKVNLPGVGKNLQDRYEVGIVSKLKENIPLIKGMKLRPPEAGEEADPQFSLWLQGEGPYTTNGATVALIKRSKPDLPDPDLLIFGLLGNFRGYYPTYSQDIGREENIFTWAILKAHTNNTNGCVKLRSSDPCDTPDINFHYFFEGADTEDDLESVINGVETVRRIIDRCGDLIEKEIYPGEAIKNREDIRSFVMNQAWGHHASCTCKMGPSNDPMSVVDNRFRVHGAKNLRIVDASIFPKIPGFFIVSAVYMISEKASDDIIEDAMQDDL